MHGTLLRARKAASKPAPPENFDGGVRMHDLTGGETEHQLLAVFFPAGGRTHTHRHTVDQVLHCFDGEIAVAIGKQRRILGPGDFIVVPKDVWHWHGATPLRDGAHYSIKPHSKTTWGGEPPEDAAEFAAYSDWATWMAGVER